MGARQPPCAATLAAVAQEIYVVEDDLDISRLVRFHLESAGFAVRQFSDARAVVASAEARPPALIVLDRMLPDGDGFELCRRIRSLPALTAIPVVFLTARGSEEDRLAGFANGADDYIVKPFSPRELVARVRALLRRLEPQQPPPVLRAGRLEVDCGAMVARLDGAPLTTTAIEFRLLEFLVRHPGRVFTRDQLLDAVWRDTAFITPRSVDVYVRRLREKIETVPGNPSYIRTLRGVGYKFEAPQ